MVETRNELFAFHLLLLLLITGAPEQRHYLLVFLDVFLVCADIQSEVAFLELSECLSGRWVAWLASSQCNISSLAWSWCDLKLADFWTSCCGLLEQLLLKQSLALAVSDHRSLLLLVELFLGGQLHLSFADLGATKLTISLSLLIFSSIEITISASGSPHLWLDSTLLLPLPCISKNGSQLFDFRFGFGKLLAAMLSRLFDVGLSRQH